MFSGLIAFNGRVVSLDGDRREGARLVIAARDAIADGVLPKDSIAVNGVCLTATSVIDDRVAFDLVSETLTRSTLGALRAGDLLNVELSLRLGERLGGHFVYGHVDATAALVGKTLEGGGQRIAVELPRALGPFIVEKGYVALDGVSLTVAAVRADRFEVALIPETLRRTTLGQRGVGDRMNLEVDPIARYAAGAASYAAGADAPTREEIAWAYEI